MKRSLEKNASRVQSREQQVTPARCQMTVGSDSRLPEDGSVVIRSLVEHECGAGVLMQDVYFDGGDVLHCYEGCLSIQLEGHSAFDVKAGETCVIYPDQRITLTTLQKRNVMLSAVLEGEGVAAYLDRFDFFNGQHGRTSEQRIPFEALKRQLTASNGQTTTEILMLLSGALLTYAHDFRENGYSLVMNAIRKIRANIKERVIRLGPLYDQLGVGHTTLHRAFADVGLKSPAAFIRDEQMRLVKRLLLSTTMPFAEIAAETGFISVTHFANFIKRCTGKTAGEIRHCGKIVSFGKI